MEYPFLQACKRKQTEYTPVWIMRQAGRYLDEYREVQKTADFMTVCKTPDLTVEVTLQPIRILGVDAAILFSDILTPIEKMGLRLQFIKGKGPVLDPPVKSMSAVDRLGVPDPEDDLPFVLESIRILRKELEGKVPLIGFCGAPFTLACYMIEGETSKDYSGANASCSRHLISSLRSWRRSRRPCRSTPTRNWPRGRRRSSSSIPGRDC